MSRFLLLLIGALSLAAGVYALLNPLPATLAATLLAGWAFLVLGLLKVLAAFRLEGWGGRIWTLLLGVVTGLVGVQILADPLGGAIALTFVVAFLFLLSGAAKLVAAVTLREVPFRLLTGLSGVVSIALAVMILTDFPVSAAGVLGILLGVELLSNGVTSIAIGLSREAREASA